MAQMRRALNRIFFKPVDQALTDELKEKRCYPFKQVDNAFILSFTLPKFWLGLFLCILSIFSMWIYQMGDSEDSHTNMGLLVIVLLGSLWLTENGAFRRHIIIYPERNEYHYYIHHCLRHRGPIHEIYIRMAESLFAPGLPIYKLVVKGYMTDEFSISDFTEKYELLEKQGKIIAETLNINYFDHHDVSTHHRVVHYPGPVQQMETV